METRGIPYVNINQNTRLIDIANRHVVQLSPGDSIGKAAAVMAGKQISSIIVTDGLGHPLGIVTENNIVFAMQSGLALETSLRGIMSSPVITAPESETCLDAYQTCVRDGIRHLVIVGDDGQLLGIVSETDFRLHLKLLSLAGRRVIASIMTRTVFNLPPEARLREALEMMQLHRDSCVVVSEGQYPVGIVTERDIVRLYADNPEQTDITVGEVMTSPVLTIDQSDTITKAAEQMLTAKIRHLVVIDHSGHLAGLITEHELTNAMTVSLVEDKKLADGALLHALFNTIPDLIWLKDANGVYLACNPRFERFFGANEKDIVGKTDYDFVDKPQADFFREHDLMAMAAGRASINEEWLTFATDGYQGWFETVKTPMHDSTGQLIGVLGIARNITERKQATELVKLSEDKYRSLIHNIPDVVWTSDQNGRTSFISDNIKNIFGYSAEEIYADPDIWFGRIHPADAGGMTQAFADLFRASRRFDVEYRIRTKAGEWIWLHDRSVVTYEKDGIHYADGVLTDVTKHKLAEELLLRQKQFSDDVISSLPGIFYMLNQQGKFVRVNSRFLEVSGYSSDESRNMPALNLFAGQDQTVISQKIRETFEKGDSWAEAEFITKSGQKIPYFFSGRRTYIDNKPYLVGFGIDISERKRAEKELLITASVFSSSQEGILITDADNKIIDVNPAFCKITGYSYEEALGKNPKFMSSGRQNQAFYTEMWESLLKNKLWRGEIWNRRKSGEVYAEMLSITLISDDDGSVLRHVAVFSDINYLKEYEAELSRAAHYDALTGIPNRVLLADRMRQAIARTVREGNMMAVCYLDLDGFKTINDSMGHEMGDQVLIEVTKRIEHTIRGGDTIARLGGDEFVVLLLGQETADESLCAAQRLLAAIARPIVSDNKTIAVSASIGLCLYPLDNVDPDTLLRHADQAMYIAKQAGKNCFHIYDPELDQRARSQQGFLKSISLGLEQGEFELFYQPKINLRTLELVGAEALIRWWHPERGLLSPSEFLRAVDNTELEIKIGEWVITSALAQMEHWRQAGLDIEISVNISGFHLESPGFCERLRQRLEEYPALVPSKLQIEILETTALNEIAVVREIMESCRELGVGFALDDFGTGYSSLSYLSRLPVDVLKIDQSFIRDMIDDQGDKAIVQGIIALAKAFERQIVAEGIETKEQSDALLGMGSEIGQGYIIARPMPADELMDWQARHAPNDL